MFTYEAVGNRIQKASVAPPVQDDTGTTRYEWDGKNRLTQVTLPDTTTVNYAYDYQNRLVSRTQGSEVRTFLFGSGNQVLEETLNGSRLALYGWGADGLASRTDANGQTLFYLKDALGSVMAIVDGRGAVVQSYEYSAFGECLSGKDAVNAFRFGGGLGMMADDDTGLTYAWNRWLDTQTGRWISEDPIRHRGGVNLYGYVGNRPTIRTDPTGLAYFMKRELSLGGIGGILPDGGQGNDEADTQLLHEQLFFEDGKRPPNIGFGTDGLFTEPYSAYAEFKQETKWGGFNDCVMREAYPRVPLQPYSLFNPNRFNCQNWATAVRQEYNRLLDDKVVAKKCGVCK